MARILVIDDDTTIRLSLKLALEDADHQVEEAADGQEGIDRFRANPVDLVVTDIFMPEKEGMELIHEIKRDRPETKIIAISGGGRMNPDDYLNIARRLGADRTLLKPFDIELLLDTVDGLLKFCGSGDAL
jgi:CheY-like chemotaxis protein